MAGFGYLTLNCLSSKNKNDNKRNLSCPPFQNLLMLFITNKQLRWWLCTRLCYYDVIYAFQSESTLYSCLNIKELLTQNRRDIWSLSDSNGIRIHNHLVRKRILSHLAKSASLTKWLSVRLGTKWMWVRIPLLPLCFLRIN